MSFFVNACVRLVDSFFSEDANYQGGVVGTRKVYSFEFTDDQIRSKLL